MRIEQKPLNILKSALIHLKSKNGFDFVAVLSFLNLFVIVLNYQVVNQYIHQFILSAQNLAWILILFGVSICLHLAGKDN